MTDLPDTTGRDLARQAACLLAHARHVLVLTGAGISAESGIPTFREAQTGLWAQFSPQDLATPEAFTAHPERVWAWYRWRRQLIARGGINAGHRAIAALSHRLALTIATQNVDGLHTAAGSPDVAELHGNIWREQCTACTAAQIIAVADNSDDSPGRCQACGAMTRPAVVWFGEMLPAEALNAARSSLDKADCVLVVGTSNRVYPAAALGPVAVSSERRVGVLKSSQACHDPDLQRRLGRFEAQPFGTRAVLRQYGVAARLCRMTTRPLLRLVLPQNSPWRGLARNGNRP